MLKSELEGDETPQAQVKQNLSEEPQAETFLEQSENESAGGVTGLPESRPINSEGQDHSVPCTRQAPNLLCLPGLLRALPQSTSAQKLGIFRESPDWEKEECRQADRAGDGWSSHTFIQLTPIGSGARQVFLFFHTNHQTISQSLPVVEKSKPMHTQWTENADSSPLYRYLHINYRTPCHRMCPAHPTPTSPVPDPDPPLPPQPHCL